ncbi:MAG: YqgE/AlgH family protein [Flavobacteriales bacterium]|nr:YqgE/AlgH family protein [Flavobacteriales bacterium]
MESEIKKGKLLISEPFIKDPTFERSVILIVEKNTLGTVGFVLNQVLDLKLVDVLESMPLNNILSNGGPVDHNTLHFLLRGSEPISGSVTVIPGLQWGGDFEELMEKVNLGMILPEDLRFFIGYSGWEPGQLEMEMKHHTWITADASLKTVFESQHDKLWKYSMKSLGGEYAMLANSPLDPQMN